MSFAAINRNRRLHAHPRVRSSPGAKALADEARPLRLRPHSLASPSRSHHPDRLWHFHRPALRRPGNIVAIPPPPRHHAAEALALLLDLACLVAPSVAGRSPLEFSWRRHAVAARPGPWLASYPSPAAFRVMLGGMSGLWRSRWRGLASSLSRPGLAALRPPRTANHRRRPPLARSDPGRSRLLRGRPATMSALITRAPGWNEGGRAEALHRRMQRRFLRADVRAGAAGEPSDRLVPVAVGKACSRPTSPSPTGRRRPCRRDGNADRVSGGERGPGHHLGVPSVSTWPRRSHRGGFIPPEDFTGNEYAAWWRDPFQSGRTSTASRGLQREPNAAALIRLCL